MTRNGSPSSGGPGCHGALADPPHRDAPGHHAPQAGKAGNQQERRAERMRDLALHHRDPLGAAARPARPARSRRWRRTGWPPPGRAAASEANSTAPTSAVPTAAPIERENCTEAAAAPKLLRAGDELHRGLHHRHGTAGEQRDAGEQEGQLRRAPGRAPAAPAPQSAPPPPASRPTEKWRRGRCG